MKPPGVARKSAANRSGQEEKASRSISAAAAGPFGDPRQLLERRRALPAQVPGPLPEERPGHVSVGLSPQMLLRAFLQEARLSDSPGQRKQPVQHLSRLLPGFARRVSIIHRLSSAPARVQPACTLCARRAGEPRPPHRDPTQHGSLSQNVIFLPRPLRQMNGSRGTSCAAANPRTWRSCGAGPIRGSCSAAPLPTSAL